MIQAFLIIIIFAILLVLVVGFGIIRAIFRIFFGGGSNLKKQHKQASHEKAQAQTQWHSAEKKKIFTKDEGEYIDFEEIKDPDKH